MTSSTSKPSSQSQTMGRESPLDNSLFERLGLSRGERNSCERRGAASDSSSSELRRAQDVPMDDNAEAQTPMDVVESSRERSAKDAVTNFCKFFIHVSPCFVN